MTDRLIYREMGRDGGRAAIPSHLSTRHIPPVIARSSAIILNELIDILSDEAIFTKGLPSLVTAIKQY